MSNKLLHNAFQVLRRLSYHIKASNVILFESINDYDGSSLEIYNYLKNNGFDKKYKLIWAVKNDDSLNNKRYNSIKYCGHSLKNLYYENRARCVFFEDRPPFSKKKDDATVIYLSHGCPMLKDTHKHINAGRHCDYCICTSSNVADLVCYNFNVTKEKLFFSPLPRNDALYENRDELQKLTDKKFGKVILWTPTFRKTASLDDGETGFIGLPLVQSESELEAINDCAKENDTLIIIKMHPRAVTGGCKALSNIIVISDGELKKKGIKLYSLLGESDALVSDYSSIAFDYMLLNKPLAYITSDIKEYRRGFAFESVEEYMPGSKINTVGDFADFITDVKNNADRFYAERSRINEWANEYRNESGAKRVCEMFIK